MVYLVQSSQKMCDKISEYCNKNYRFLRKNPRLFWMRKLARFEVLRDLMLCFYKPPENSYEIGKNPPSIFSDLNVYSVVSSLKTDGYCLGINLPQDVVKEILEFAKSTACYGERDPKIELDYSEKEQGEAATEKQVQICSYLNKIESCPAVKKLESDPGLLAISAKFLGTDPVHIGTELWWSFPVSATQLQRIKAAQVFHYDLDDYRSIKFFFYLTDVDASSGPHVCIRGTHKNKKFLHQLLGQRCASKEDKEIVEDYGAENVVTICGKAGFGFVEDSCCFHKGAPPSDKERLLLQIEFAINDYGNIREF